MSGPTRQKSLKDRLKDGIGLSWQRRRNSASANLLTSTNDGSSVTNRNFKFIPSLNKAGKGNQQNLDSYNHGYINPLESEQGGRMKEANALDTLLSGSNAVGNKQSLNTTSSSGRPRADTLGSEGGSVCGSPHSPLDRKSTSSAGSGSGGSSSSLSKTITQPPGTVPYTVGSEDTLAGLAARFETVPSELVKLNRLVSRLIFPGQVIYVPEIVGRPRSQSSPLISPVQEMPGKIDLTANGKRVGRLPGHAERIFDTPPNSPADYQRMNQHTTPNYGAEMSRQYGNQQADKTKVPADERSLDRECHERFLKINVRHVTDGQGVVSGVLLVTPNAVMFDPNVSDPLVIEHGPDKYGVIAPMDFVVNAAMYNDIAHMRVRHAPPGYAAEHAPTSKPEIYHNPNCGMFPKPRHKSDSANPNCSFDQSDTVSRSKSDREMVMSSISDRAEHGSPVDDRESLCSCASDNTKELKSPDSDVFMEEGDSIAVVKQLLSDCLDKVTTTLVGENADKEGLSIGSAAASLSQAASDEATAQQERAWKPNSDSPTMGKTGWLDSIAEDPTKNEAGSASRSPKRSAYAQCHQQQHSPLPNKGPPALMQFLGLEGFGGNAVGGGGAVSGSSAGSSMRSSTSSMSPQSDGERKHPAVDCESRKQKVFKKLSNPLTWMESLGSTEKENMAPPSYAEATGMADSPSTPGSQSTLGKILSSAANAPKNLVDFSSGLFVRTSESDNKISDLMEPNQNSASLHPLSPRDSGAEKADSSCSSTTTSSVTGSASSSAHSSTATSPNRRMSMQDAFSSSSKGHMFKRRSSENSLAKCLLSATAEEHEVPKVDFKSVISVQDVPKLFQSIDQLIPRPAQWSNSPPLYLCLRMGKPLDREIPRSTPIMSYGKKRMRMEYWFSIPRDRVDDLYNFFQHWAPDVYGDVDECEIAARGFALIATEDELSSDDEEGEFDITTPLDTPTSGMRSHLSHFGGSLAGGREMFSRRRRKSKDVVTAGGSGAQGTGANGEPGADWEIIKAPYIKLLGRLRRDTQSSSTSSEIVSVSEAHRLHMSLDIELPLPDLMGKSEILNDQHRKEISMHLPARILGYSWTLIFSSAEHGFSLKTLYRRMAKYDTPTLLVVQDTENEVFGALISCSLKVSDHFYGTGESFLYTFYPKFKVFSWSGENMYFVKGNPESLAVGAGDGYFGIWLDGDLYHGRSQPCKTYANHTLSRTEDFHVKTLEIWGFFETETNQDQMANLLASTAAT